MGKFRKTAPFALLVAAGLAAAGILVPAGAENGSHARSSSAVPPPAAARHSVGPSVSAGVPSATTPHTGAAAGTGTAPWAPSPAKFAESSVHNLGVTMSDGTVIRVDVYYPTRLCPTAPCGAVPASVAGGFPALLQQTPYGKGNITEAAGMFATDVPSLVAQGYVVVVADVRGTGASGGSWGLFDPAQATDGATLARWAADDMAGGTGISQAVPGLAVDHQLGLFGASYMGINQFLTVAALDATSGPNPVKAMFPMITGNDIYRDTVTEGGLFNTEFSVAYVALVNSLSGVDPVFDTLEGLQQAAANGNLPPNALADELSAIPGTELAHAGAVTQYDVPSVVNIESGGDEAYDAGGGLGPSGYWAQRNPVNVLSQVVHDGIAAFLVGGWNDLFQRGELMNYTGLQNAWYDASTGAHEPVTGPMAPGQPTSPKYQLLMGPWMHITAGSGTNLTSDELQWFATWMSGPAADPNTPMSNTTDPLHLYELGSGSWNATQHTGNWFDLADWPVPGGSSHGYAATQYFFGPTGSGPSALSDNQGGLTTEAPASSSASDTLVYAGVSNPCTVNTDQWGAGALQAGEANLGSGATSPCEKNDVLYGTGPGAATYTSAPMASDEVLAGPIDATVYATSTTSDTEWMADVEAVSPSGQSVPLTTGGLLGSLRAEESSMSWLGGDGAPLVPFHPYTSRSRQSVVPGQVTRYDLEVFPTFASIPKGWSVRITLSTADTPHVFPTPGQLLKLLGGVYHVERNRSAASFVNLPLVPATAFSSRCSPSVCTS